MESTDLVIREATEKVVETVNLVKGFETATNLFKGHKILRN